MEDESIDNVLVAATERQLRQLGYELHETICQSLAGISICTDLLTRRCQAGKPIEVAELEKLGRELGVAIAQVRGLYRKFDPVFLNASGLLEALNTLAEVTTTTALPCEFRCESPVFVHNPEQALALYRVAQEAVRNAVQHSHARRITLSLTQTTDAVTLAIADDGRGFTPAPAGDHLTGFRIMETYARAADARLSIELNPGEGTTVACRLAIRKQLVRTVAHHGV
ncbi:MAG TPA: ATP-binding protein [Candidatus Limnocylindria bacterium]|nr:ATP-binding protein [Candidatus Limnocylindria bacterium]